MLRRTQPQPVETIDLLREQNLKKYTNVFTSDGERIGITMRFVHRPILEANDDLKLYRSYLVVQSIVLGGTSFIPTVFIGDYDPLGNRLNLTVELETMAEETWNRKPDFVAHGNGVYEELPE